MCTVSIPLACLFLLGAMLMAPVSHKPSPPKITYQEHVRARMSDRLRIFDERMRADINRAIRGLVDSLREMCARQMYETAQRAT
jgi:hypothetical protein